jgi:DNA polymerase type B, organellar and viral
MKTLNTIETHDLFLRALAIPILQKKAKKKKDVKATGEADDSREEAKWPEVILLFDTECRTTVDQSLTFGVWRRCKLVDRVYVVIEEGVFYSDDLPANEVNILKKYIETAIPDVRSFPPRFPLYPRTKFMKKVFWRALKRDGAMIAGFNLGFDLTRLALEWRPGDKGEWSLIFEKYSDGNENVNYPRILITPIDSKKQIIKLWKPCTKKLKGRVPAHQWKDGGRKIHFLDLRTLLWAQYNKSYSLRSASDDKRGPFRGQNLPQKGNHDPTGEVTPEEIDYCRQDVRCTVALLNACKREFDKHVDIDLKPWNAYSPASMAKAHLKAMGIERPETKFKIQNAKLGPWIQSYYGGRSECRIRHEVVPVVPVDFTSEYPSCCANLGLFKLLTADSIEFVDDTEAIRQFLEKVTLPKCYDRTIWPKLNFVARVMPDGDILPIRTVYDGQSQNIGNNHLHPNPIHPEAIYMAGPDLVATVIQQPGKIPKIEQAFRIVPTGRQAGMRAVRLRGKVPIDPNDNSVDLFTKIIEERKRNKDDADLSYWLKILANSIYGFFVELIPERFEQPKNVMVFSGDEIFPDSSRVREKRGKWFAPYLATLITSAGRLLLAMLEAEVKQANGTYLYCDTDSLAIVASKEGGKLRVPGASETRILTLDEVDQITAKFRALNPYDPETVRELLNLTDDNHVCICSHELKSEHDEYGSCEVPGCQCQAAKEVRRQLWGLGIAAKRYVLFEKVLDRFGKLIDIKIVNPKAHGIGFLYPPTDNPKNWKKDAPLWIYEMWDYIVRGFLSSPRKLPAWAFLPQMMRFSVSTWNVIKMLGMWADARPHNFMFMVMTSDKFSFDFDYDCKPHKKPMVIVPFSSKQNEWRKVEGFDIHNKDRRGRFRQYRMDDPDFLPLTYAHMMEEYIWHPEVKSLGPDGTPCSSTTRGLLQRAHITAGQIRYIDKETSSMWSQSDDLTVISADEIGFRVVEYGKNRRIALPDSVKREIGRMGLRELRRKKIGQHTIEKALHAHVRADTYRKILAAIKEYKREQSGCS